MTRPPMTPTQAQQVLAHSHTLGMEEQHALETIAADTVEWAVMLTSYGESYIAEDWWYQAEYEAKGALRGSQRYTPHLSPRLVARRVSEPWEVAGDE